MMANYPRRPEKKLPDPGQKHNAQGDHAGVAHRPEEFDVMNPEKQRLGPEQPVHRPKAPKNHR